MFSAIIPIICNFQNLHSARYWATVNTAKISDLTRHYSPSIDIFCVNYDLLKYSDFIYIDTDWQGFHEFICSNMLNSCVITISTILVLT